MRTDCIHFHCPSPPQPSGYCIEHETEAGVSSRGLRLCIRGCGNRIDQRLGNIRVCPACRNLEGAKRSRKVRNKKRSKMDQADKFEQKYILIILQQGKCVACLTAFPPEPSAAHLDHIVPLSMWGTSKVSVNHPGNLQLLCRLCNIEKSNQFAYSDLSSRQQRWVSHPDYKPFPQKFLTS